MNKLLLGLVVAAAIAAGAYFLMQPRSQAPVANVSTVTMSNPMGQSRDPNDPGEEHYRQGRYPEALAYWTAQAEKGNPQAAHRLGVEYMDGKGGVVPGCTQSRCPDFEKAMRYHRQAALAGNPLSMFDIGSMFEYGLGREVDIALAARWYGHAASYGLAQAQHNYATMLEAGEGVKQDLVEAYKFFVLAARGGFTGIPYDNRSFRIDRNAPMPTDILRGKMTPQQVDEGRARADSFKPLTGPLQGE